MKKNYSIIILLFLCTSAYAQQEVLVSKNVFNELLYNPAYAGTHSYYNATLLGRSQWTGFTGAPNTQMLEVDGPFFKEKMGLGLVISHDKIGVTEETDVYASYSYKIKIANGKLAFGLRGGFTNYKAKLSTLTVWDETDKTFTDDVKTYYIPKFGFGMYYYTETYYVGLTVPTLIAYDENYNFSADIKKSSFIRSHYYLNGGCVLKLKESTLKLKPTVLLRYVPSAPLQMDISTSLIYKDMFTFGVAFRTGDAVIAMLEYRTSFRLRMGYSYDFTFSKIRNYSGGTHEILIGYEFGAGKDKNVSPRYF